jgi:hypothetical protein
VRKLENTFFKHISRKGTVITMKFIHIGFGNMVAADRVVAVVSWLTLVALVVLSVMRYCFGWTPSWPSWVQVWLVALPLPRWLSWATMCTASATRIAPAALTPLLLRVVSMLLTTTRTTVTPCIVCSTTP